MKNLEKMINDWYDTKTKRSKNMLYNQIKKECEKLGLNVGDELEKVLIIRLRG